MWACLHLIQLKGRSCMFLNLTRPLRAQGSWTPPSRSAARFAIHSRPSNRINFPGSILWKYSRRSDDLRSSLKNSVKNLRPQISFPLTESRVCWSETGAHCAYSGIQFAESQRAPFYMWVQIHSARRPYACHALGADSFNFLLQQKRTSKKETAWNNFAW